MSALTASPILILLIASVFSPAPARAQDPSLAGQYRLVPEQSDHVGDAVAEATEGAGFFVRTMGRRMLTGRLTPAEQIRITLTDTLVVIGSDKGPERPILVVGDPGHPPRGRDGEGDQSVAFAWWDGPVLGARFTEDEGTREYRYALQPDGRTLQVEVRVDGGKLPRPVELSLTYARNEPLLEAQGSVH